MTIKALSPIQLSLALHFLLAALTAMLLYRAGSGPEVINVDVQVTAPAQVQNLMKAEEKPQVVLKSINQTEQATALKKRQVFGVNRQSLTAGPDSKTGIDAKLGNTLAKEADREELKSDDADVLPVPTEEYLVSQMPRVLREVRPEYPPEARAQGLEGVVTMSILIDDKGTVREVQVLSGPDIFRAGAVQAMRQFQFQPAQANGANVAVRIAYTIRFTLDY